MSNQTDNPLIPQHFEGQRTATPTTSLEVLPPGLLSELIATVQAPTSEPGPEDPAHAAIFRLLTASAGDVRPAMHSLACLLHAGLAHWHGQPAASAGPDNDEALWQHVQLHASGGPGASEAVLRVATIAALVCQEPDRWASRWLAHALVAADVSDRVALAHVLVKVKEDALVLARAHVHVSCGTAFSGGFDAGQLYELANAAWSAGTLELEHALQITESAVLAEVWAALAAVLRSHALQPVTATHHMQAASDRLWIRQWCSWCFNYSEHSEQQYNAVRRCVYACETCAGLTVQCMMPGCQARAREGFAMCAVHCMSSAPCKIRDWGCAPWDDRPAGKCSACGHAGAHAPVLTGAVPGADTRVCTTCRALVSRCKHCASAFAVLQERYHMPVCSTCAALDVVSDIELTPAYLPDPGIQPPIAGLPLADSFLCAHRIWVRLHERFPLEVEVVGLPNSPDAQPWQVHAYLHAWYRQQWYWSVLYSEWAVQSPLQVLAEGLTSADVADEAIDAIAAVLPPPSQVHAWAQARIANPARGPATRGLITCVPLGPDTSSTVQATPRVLRFPSLPRAPRSICRVLPMVDGAAYYDVLASAIQGAQRQILISAWMCTPQVFLRRHPYRQRLDVLLQIKAAEGVKIRALLWSSSDAVRDGAYHSGEAAAALLQGLHPNISAISHPQPADIVRSSTWCTKRTLDPVLWCHHQKFVVVDDVVAFAGGIDLLVGRYDTGQHQMLDPGAQTYLGLDYCSPAREPGPRSTEEPFKDVVNRRNTPRMPWHDTQVGIAGTAAYNLAQLFEERWRDHSCRVRKPSLTVQERLLHTLPTQRVQVARASPAAWNWNVARAQAVLQALTTSPHSVVTLPTEPEDAEFHTTKPRPNAHFTCNSAFTGHSVVVQVPRGGYAGAAMEHMRIPACAVGASAVQHIQLRGSQASAPATAGSSTTANSRADQNSPTDITAVPPVTDLGAFDAGASCVPDVLLRPDISDISGHAASIDKRAPAVVHPDAVGGISADAEDASSQTFERSGKFELPKLDYPVLPRSRYPSPGLSLPELVNTWPQARASLACSMGPWNMSDWSHIPEQQRAGLATAHRWVAERTLYGAYISAIDAAQHYILLENQYFISALQGGGVLNRVGHALWQKLRKVIRAGQCFRVLILLPFPEEAGGVFRTLYMGAMHTLWAGQHSLCGRLAAEFPAVDLTQYIGLFMLRGWGLNPISTTAHTEQIFMHSKTLLVDDRVAIVASANVNDRSLAGDRDDEAGFVVDAPGLHGSLAALPRDELESRVDVHQGCLSGLPFTVCTAVQHMRLRLLREYVGAPVDSDILQVSGRLAQGQASVVDVRTSQELAADRALEDLTCARTWQRLQHLATANAALLQHVFATVPRDQYGTFAALLQARRAQPLPRDPHLLAGTRGLLVPLPRKFLIDEALELSLRDVEALAPKHLMQ